MRVGNPFVDSDHCASNISRLDGSARLHSDNKIDEVYHDIFHIELLLLVMQSSAVPGIRRLRYDGLVLKTG